MLAGRAGRRITDDDLEAAGAPVVVSWKTHGRRRAGHVTSRQRALAPALAHLRLQVTEHGISRQIDCQWSERGRQSCNAFGTHAFRDARENADDEPRVVRIAM